MSHQHGFFMSFYWRSCMMVGVGLAYAAPSFASSFEDALTAAYSTNPHIEAERQRQQATDEYIAQAASNFRPTIGADYEYGRQRTSFGGAPWTYGEAQTKELNVSQPLFRGGGSWSAYKSAIQRARAEEFTLSSVEQTVLMQTITSYMDIVANSAILGLAHNNQETLTQELDSNNIRFKVGEVTRTDVAQSQSRVEESKAAVTTAQGQLDNAIATFIHNAGYRPEGTLTVPVHLPVLPVSLEDALEQGRSANPALIAALHSAKSALYDVRTSQATLLPTVALVGTLDRQAGAGADGLSDFHQDKVVVQVTIPIYEAGNDYSHVRQAEATARQRDHDAMDQRLQTDQQVAQAWQQYQTATGNIASRREQIKAAQAAVDGMKQEQDAGVRAVRDVLDAEAELFDAHTNLVHAQRDQIVSAYNLAFTLGQLTPANLGLNVAQEDPSAEERAMKWKVIGF